MCRNPPRFSDLRTSRRFKHASACCEFAVCCIGAEKQFYKTMLMERKRLILDQSLSLLNEQGEATWFPFTQHVKESYVVSDLLSDMRKIEAMFCTDIGIPNANTDKKERLISDEVNANNVETSSRCEMWLEEIRKGLTKANEKYNLKLTVEWRVNPDQTWEGI